MNAKDQLPVFSEKNNFQPFFSSLQITQWLWGMIYNIDVIIMLQLTTLSTVLHRYIILQQATRFFEVTC